MAKQLPNRLREWRKAAGLTLEEAAWRLGTTNQTLSRYETGKRSVTVDMLQQIAPVYCCKPADLLPDPEQSLSEEERAIVGLLRVVEPDDRRYIARLLSALAGSEAPDAADRLKRRLA